MRTCLICSHPLSASECRRKPSVSHNSICDLCTQEMALREQTQQSLKAHQAEAAETSRIASLPDYDIPVVDLNQETF